MDGEFERFPFIPADLPMGVVAFLQDGLPPVLVVTTHLDGLGEERRQQAQVLRDQQRCLLEQGWALYTETAPAPRDHGWALSVLVSPDEANAMVMQAGIPMLYSGPLFEKIRTQEKEWITAVAGGGSVLIFYCLDPGPLPDADELERRLRTARVYFIEVPAILAPGSGHH